MYSSQEIDKIARFFLAKVKGEQLRVMNDRRRQELELNTPFRGFISNELQIEAAFLEY